MVQNMLAYGAFLILTVLIKKVRLEQSVYWGCDNVGTGVNMNRNICLTQLFRVRSRDGVVVTATRYGLEGPGIDSRWERDFPHLSRPAPRPTQPPVQWVPGLSRG
jgi:hypothetical protein